jgi:hypothetical protein
MKGSIETRQFLQMNSDRLQTVSIARAAVLAQYGDVEDVQRKDMGRCSTTQLNQGRLSVGGSWGSGRRLCGAGRIKAGVPP